MVYKTYIHIKRLSHKNKGLRVSDGGGAGPFAWTGQEPGRQTDLLAGHRAPPFLRHRAAGPGVHSENGSPPLSLRLGVSPPSAPPPSE